MYKVLFIDEQQSALDKFLRYVEYYKDDSISAEVLLPLRNLDEMLDSIFDKAPDAIISDYRLNEYKTEIQYNVPYNGIELVHSIWSRRECFPCFVLTTFSDEAIPSSEDVNIVYEKEIIYKAGNEGTKVTFLNRIKEQIRQYRTRIFNAETELLQLLELRKDGQATLDNEARIIELDSFLEKIVDKRASIPAEYKMLSNQEQLSKLLSEVDKLIDKFDKK
jgi:hypothetical protein